MIYCTLTEIYRHRSRCIITRGQFRLFASLWIFQRLMKSWRRRNGVILRQYRDSMLPHTSDSPCAQHRHDCTIRIYPHLPLCRCEFRHATVFVGDAVNIYRLSLRATSCLTKINYSSRRHCTKHRRTPLFITSWRDWLQLQLALLRHTHLSDKLQVVSHPKQL